MENKCKYTYCISSKKDFVNKFAIICSNLKFKEVNKNEKPLISSRNMGGKIWLELSGINLPQEFNKIATTKKLKNSIHYPPTFIIENEKEFNNLKLDDKYYFVKPKFGWACKTISLIFNKNIIFNNGIKYPLIIQQEIIPNTINQYKYDYRIYVIYVKHKNIINAYSYPIGIKRICSAKYSTSTSTSTSTQFENKTPENMLSYFEGNKGDVCDVSSNNIIECLKEVQPHIIPRIHNKNETDIEIELVGYDVIEDETNKAWVIEINAMSAYFHDKKFRKFQTDLIHDILYMINNYQNEINNKQIKFKKFIKLTKN